MAEADADQETPLRYTAEGLPVFSDWDDSPAPVDPEKAEFEAKLAAARAAYDAPAEPEEVPDDISTLIDAADAAVTARAERKARARPAAGPAAPVRKTGKQPEKLLAGFKVVEDPDIPRGAPMVVGEPPPEDLPPAQPRPKRNRKKSARKDTLPPAARQIEDISDEQLLAEAGVVPVYSTTEAAQFFDRTNQWLYWGLGRDEEGHAPIFVHPDGSPIEPEWIGNPREGRRRFTLPIIKDILLSSYRRGNIEPEELKRILRRIRINELGGEWREREGWRRIRGKWVHPNQAEQVNGTWVRKKKETSDSE